MRSPFLTTGRRRRTTLAVSAAVAAATLLPVLPAGAAVQPPYSGTIFVDPDIITDADPTSYVSVTGLGRGQRSVLDRRAGREVTINALLFRIRYGDGTTTEAVVNPEFGSVQGRAEAVRYGQQLGRMPALLRHGVKQVVIHRGDEPWSGYRGTVLVHTGLGEDYAPRGIVAETLVHEATHAVLDDKHAATSGWTAAQRADPTFISTYARDHATREDLAETVLLYAAVRKRPGRLSAQDRVKIRAAIPHRFAYLNGLDLRFPG